MIGIQRSVGVYVSSREVVIVELTKGPSKYRLSQFVQQTLPEGTELFRPPSSEIPADLSSLDQGPVSTLIQQLKSQIHSATEVIFFSAFSPESILIRHFKMMKLPKKEWDVGIRFEARKYLPFNLEQMRSDYLVFPMPKAATEMEISFFAIDETKIEQLLSLLGKLDLPPEGIESGWLSALRILRWNREIQGSENGILFCAESDRLSLSLFKDGIPYFDRDVRWSESVGDNQSEEFFDSVSGEIRLAMDFHRKNFPDKPATGIYGFGNWFTEELKEKLASECGISVFAVNPLTKLSVEKPIKLSAGVVVSIGLALRGLMKEKSGTSIDLGGRFIQVVHERARLTSLVGVETVVLLLVLFGVQGWSSSRIRAAKQLLEGTIRSRPKVAELTQTASSMEQLSNLKEHYRQEVSLLQNLVDKRVYLTPKWKALPKTLPDEMWIDSLEWKEKIHDQTALQDRFCKIIGLVYSEDPQKEVELINSFAADLKANQDFFQGFQQAELAGIQQSRLGTQGVRQFEWIGFSSRGAFEEIGKPR